MMGGTVPTDVLVDALQLPFVLVPTVNADNNQHARDENLRVGHFLTRHRDRLQRNRSSGSRTMPTLSVVLPAGRSSGLPPVEMNVPPACVSAATAASMSATRSWIRVEPASCDARRLSGPARALELDELDRRDPTSAR